MEKETLRMQMLAGIITESQYKEKINENSIEGIDVSLVKDLMNDPNIKKASAQLKADPKSLKNVIKFIADHSNDNTPLNEETVPTYSVKERIKAMLTGAGIAAPLGFLFGFMADAGSIDSGMHGLVAALTTAVLGAGIGALATWSDTQVNEADMSIEDQIQKIVDLGKSM